MNLWSDGSPNNPPSGARPSLEIYAPFNAERRVGAVVVIFPGGGYGSLSPYERLDAEYFRGLGYTAIVVNYRVGMHCYPGAYADAARAVRLVRSRAGEWGYPANRIVVLGGSAGGHLAALLATEPELYRDPSDDLAGKVSARPDRLILLYPVIKAIGPDAHTSIEHLLGAGASTAEKMMLSPDLHVTARMPPTIIFHAADDPVVTVENSLAFARACWAAKVSAELHVFPRGGHGKNFAYDAEVSPKWRHLVEEWLSFWLSRPAGEDAVGVGTAPGAATRRFTELALLTQAVSSQLGQNWKSSR